MGADLWEWLTYRKQVVDLPLGELVGALPELCPDVVIDNVRPETSPAIASTMRARRRSRLVSLRADVADTSFDVIAHFAA